MKRFENINSFLECLSMEVKHSTTYIDECLDNMVYEFFTSIFNFEDMRECAHIGGYKWTEDNQVDYMEYIRQNPDLAEFIADDDTLLLVFCDIEDNSDTRPYVRDYIARREWQKYTEVIQNWLDVFQQR